MAPVEGIGPSGSLGAGSGGVVMDGVVVWFTDAGLGVRGIVNGNPYEVVTDDGVTRVLVPVHQPQTNQNLTRSPA